jgi:methionine synthase I (cobalamin-dependent)
MHPLLRDLLSAAPILTDGAWGTQLQARGLAVGEFPDLWNIDHPEKVLEVARAYVAAGSQVILTNTFGANRIRLAVHGLENRAVELNQRGAALSKEAAGTSAKVFASIGPTGALLMSGDVTPEQVSAAFAEQAQALAQGGADALVVETMADLEEACLAVKAAGQTGLPVVACMVFDSGKDHDRTMMGTTPEAAAKALVEAGADVVGANCGQGIVGFIPICRRMHAAVPVPIWAKANAGLPEMIGGVAVYQTAPEDFAAHIPELVQAGASFVGGCCGTSPQFIAAAKKCLDASRLRV